MRAILVLLLLAPSVAAAPLLASPHTVLCFLDGDGDGLRGRLEPLYLQAGACAGGARAADARLSDGDFPGGTLVSGNDDDTSRTHGALVAGYGFFDADGNGVVSSMDSLYLHLGALPGTLAPGDIPLTGADAFQPLEGSDPRVGNPLAPAPVAIGGESYAETDGNPGFTVGDVLFLDLDGNLVTSIGDLRLAAGTAQPHGSAEAGTSSSPASSTTTSSSETTTSQATTSGATTVADPSTNTGSSVPSARVPFLGLATTLVLLATVVLVRRRLAH